MKIKSDMWQKCDKWQVARDKNVHAPVVFPCHPSPVTRHSENGIALVITLILLSVTLVMAVAFLAISQRERSSVTTTTDATTARLAAETALAQAESQIVSSMLATTNPYSYGLLVSTNYINQNGFISGVADPLNVNYAGYTNAGGSLSAADLQQNIANLFLNPRVPVYIATNGGADFRFYLDLNRNGRFDTNGVVTNVDNASPPNGLGTVSAQVGDPEWVGVLERPDTTHGPNNKFLSRFAFIALPVGNSLDVNYIHNQARSLELSSGNSGFFRNEGVGSWEINLAAFLTDLNTNQWDPPTIWNAAVNPYTYQEPNFNNTGRGFEDALSILNYRYSGNYNTLAIPTVNAYSALVNAGIDSYTYGSLMTNTQLPLVNFPAAPAYWVGSDNANHFFTPAEFFTRISPPFAFSLFGAGNSASTYDRYTFYRMLSQLGTDSTPESGLMNVNYDNLDPGINGLLDVNGTASVTNFVPWTPIGFFTSAADRMLRLSTTNWFQAGPSNYLATYYGVITNFTDPTGFGLTNFPYFGITNGIPGFGVANIPVLANGIFVYSPAVNRVLQLAANMYDAIYYTNHTFGGTAFPTVFQPTFSIVNNSNVYIANFIEQPDAAFLASDTIRNLNIGPTAVAALRTNDLVFGVPLIIGAKKGFPNFNEFYMESTFQLTRKLMVTRTDTNATVASNPSAFNYYEMFNLSLSNHLGVECWNSYRTNYARVTDIYVTNYLTMTLTNDEGFNAGVPAGIALSGYLQIPNPWSGYNSKSPIPSFQIPLATNYAGVPVSMYRFNDPVYPYPYNLSTNLNLPFETSLGGLGKYPQPHWGMAMTNNLQVIMVDDATKRIIDYVQLSGPNTSRDLTAEIQQGYDAAIGVKDTRYNNQWNTSLIGGVPAGVSEQLQVSQGNGVPTWSATLWGPDEKSAYDQMNGLNVFLNGKGVFMLAYPGYPGFDPTLMGIAGTTNAMQAAYTPTATVVQHITWQANDPLVHYIASDLQGGPGNNLDINVNWPGNLGKLNDRYMPWGGNPLLTGADKNPYNPAIKDPLIYSSDNWDFPTYKFPTVGWLGRVHRGTPWQTVYLKASNILKTIGMGAWTNWTGNVNFFDATNTGPLQDRLLFDLFTTAPNDNATRGQLSVNVGSTPGGDSLAAWSALFSGMVTPPTSLTNNYSVISPAGASGTNSLVGQLAVAVNNRRAVFTNADGVVGAFEHKGDILSTAQLTEQSPFLDLTKTNYNSDEIYEWLPQQAMSLLRGPNAPRYVIYCYGQALKPAPNGIVTSSGPFFQMVTNYQVVTESAARAVVRVEGANTKSPHIVVESFNLLPPD